MQNQQNYEKSDLQSVKIRYIYISKICFMCFYDLYVVIFLLHVTMDVKFELNQIVAKGQKMHKKTQRRKKRDKGERK